MRHPDRPLIPALWGSLSAAPCFRQLFFPEENSTRSSGRALCWHAYERNRVEQSHHESSTSTLQDC